MQKDMRVSLKNHIHFNDTSIIKGDVLFFTHIIEKYGIEIKLKSFPYLQYLLRHRVHKTSSNSQYFSAIQKKSYHNDKHIINKVVIDDRSIRTHEDQNIINFYHKGLMHYKLLTKKSQNLKNLLQNSLKSETLLLNTTRLQLSVPNFEKSIINNNSLTSESPNNINFYYQNIYHKKVLKQKHQNNTNRLSSTILNKPIRTQESHTFPVNFITHEKRTENLRQNSIPNYDQDINNQTITKNATIIYNKNKEEEKTVFSEPIINEKVLKKIIKERNIIENSHSEPSTVIETNINNLNPYDIKKLATKIYPFIINQWQKEFERRGVFYG